MWLLKLEKECILSHFTHNHLNWELFLVKKISTEKTNKLVKSIQWPRSGLVTRVSRLVPSWAPTPRSMPHGSLDLIRRLSTFMTICFLWIDQINSRDTVFEKTDKTEHPSRQIKANSTNKPFHKRVIKCFLAWKGSIWADNRLFEFDFCTRTWTISLTMS